MTKSVCAWCEKEWGQITNEQIAAHWKECPNHPIQIAALQNGELRAENNRLRQFVEDVRDNEVGHVGACYGDCACVQQEANRVLRGEE